MQVNTNEKILYYTIMTKQTIKILVSSIKSLSGSLVSKQKMW